MSLELNFNQSMEELNIIYSNYSKFEPIKDYPILKNKVEELSDKIDLNATKLTFWVDDYNQRWIKEVSECLINLFDNLYQRDLLNSDVKNNSILNFLEECQDLKSLGNVIITFNYASKFNTDLLTPLKKLYSQHTNNDSVLKDISEVFNANHILADYDRITKKDRVLDIRHLFEFYATKEIYSLFEKFGSFDQGIYFLNEKLTNFHSSCFDHHYDEKENNQFNLLTSFFSELGLACKSDAHFLKFINFTGKVVNKYKVLSRHNNKFDTLNCTENLIKLFGMIHEFKDQDNYFDLLIFANEINSIETLEDNLDLFKDEITCNSFNPKSYGQYINKFQNWIEDEEVRNNLSFENINSLVSTYHLARNITKVSDFEDDILGEKVLNLMFGHYLNEVISEGDNFDEKITYLSSWIKDINRLIKTDPELFKTQFMQSYKEVGA